MRVVIEPRDRDEIAGALIAVGALFGVLVAVTIVFFVVRVGAEVIAPGADPAPAATEPAPPASVTAHIPPPPPPTPPPTCYPFQPC